MAAYSISSLDALVHFEVLSRFWCRTVGTFSLLSEKSRISFIATDSMTLHT